MLTMMHRVAIILSMAEDMRDEVLKGRMTEAGHASITLLGMKGSNQATVMGVLEPLIQEGIFSLRKQGMSLEKVRQIGDAGIRSMRLPAIPDWTGNPHKKTIKVPTGVTGRPMIFNRKTPC